MIQLNHKNTWVINLAERVDRLSEFHRQCVENKIDYTLFPAVKNENGKLGLICTMHGLLKKLIDKDVEYALIFEDDAQLVSDVSLINKSISQLPEDFSVLYFGGYLIKKPTRLYSENLFKVDTIYSTHAILYSRSAMIKIVGLISNMLSKHRCLAYDELISSTIQKEGKAYCTYPSIFKQRPGYSDIEDRDVDYTNYHEKVFEEMTSHFLEG